MKIKKSGGKRLGAGRKPLYNVESETIKYIIPSCEATILKEYIKKLIEKYKKKYND